MTSTTIDRYPLTFGHPLNEREAVSRLNGYLYVIGIDPGESVGFALVNLKGILLTAKTIEAPEFVNNIDHYVNRFRTAVIVEAQPAWTAHNTVPATITRTIEERNSSVVKVQPGHWKGHPSNGILERHWYTKHEQDAYNIARYWIAREKGISQDSAE